MELNFGNYEAALDLIESIAYRAGIGDILAEGVNNAAKAFGQDSEDFAMQVKGLEFPAYDPRVGYGTALSYAVSPRGGHTCWKFWAKIIRTPLIRLLVDICDEYGFHTGL